MIRIVGPSGDGCHVEVNGKWYAFGNIPENAWKAALSRALANVAQLEKELAELRAAQKGVEREQ